MASDHTELLAYLTSIDSKVDQLAKDINAIRSTLNTKVDQHYCVERCQPRWTPRSYVAATTAVCGIMIAAAAFVGDLMNLGSKIGLGGK